MGWAEIFEASGKLIMSREELIAWGATGRMLTSAVGGGFLQRARRDHYALPSVSRAVLEAVRIGGRLGCVSALAHAGVFAFDTRFTHLHVEPTMSRLRSPRSRFLALDNPGRDGAELHWSALIEPDGGNEYSVGIIDALAQSALCQEPWHTIASIDNALFLSLIRPPQLDALFAALPERLQWMRPLINGRSEAGQESILRLIVISRKLSCELQVTFPRVGRVDLLVEGCTVVEADSRLAHNSWDLHVRDRNRDMELARLGYPSLRPVYQRIMFTPDEVGDAILHLLDSNTRFRRSIS